jgi:hypothetical protein
MNRAPSYPGRHFRDLSSLGIIFGGMTYARGRELLRQTDPHRVYEQINRESFDGELPDVPVV